MLRKTLPILAGPAPDETREDVAREPVLAIVDGALAAYAGRERISRDEVVDLLLDLRNAVATAMLFRELEREPLRV